MASLSICCLWLPATAYLNREPSGIDRFLLAAGWVVGLLVLVLLKMHPVYAVDFDLRDTPGPDLTKCFAEFGLFASCVDDPGV